MAVIAGRLLAMPSESFPNGEFGSPQVRFDFARIGRWRSRRIVEQHSQNVLAAFDRFGAVPIRSPQMNAGHSQQATTLLVGVALITRQCDATQFWPCDSFNAIQLRQPLIE